MPASPQFWWQDGSVARRLLSPVGHVYGAVTARRMGRAGATLAVPVVCVGNFVAGGAGKTPTILWLAERLVARGHRPAVLSRGYGRDRSDDAVIAVDPGRHLAHEVGDEPLLIARVAPCFVSADRRLSAKAALMAGATVLLLDDGLQNPALAKTVSIAVVDGATGIGNGACVPAGPLRAPIERQLPFVSLILVIGAGQAGADVAALGERRGVTVAQATLQPAAACAEALQGQRLLAFAGIGRPQKFFRTLDDLGVAVVGRRSFPDHHRFSAADLAALRQEAKSLGAALVTTEKDRVRLPAAFEVLTLPVSLAVDDAAALDGLLSRLA